MEEKEIACPYCGHQIKNTDEQCSNCKEFFVEPNLSGFKLVSIPLYIAFEVVLSTIGLPFFYSIFWIILNYKNICNLAMQKDLKKFNILFIAFCLLVLLTTVYKLFIFADVVVEIFLAYRTLRIIEKFTLKKYNSPVTHHELGMIFFRTLYIIYYLDTYLIRVKNPDMRYCMDTDNWFKYSVIFLLFIVLLFILGFISIPILGF